MYPKLWHCCSVVLSYSLLHVGDTFFFPFKREKSGNQWIIGVSNRVLLKLHLKDQIWEWIIVDPEARFAVVVVKMYHDFAPLFCSILQTNTVCFLFIPVLSFELKMQKNWETRIPPPEKSPSPLACRCVLKLCVRLRAAPDCSLQLPACLRVFWLGFFFPWEGCIIVFLTGIC